MKKSLFLLAIMMAAMTYRVNQQVQVVCKVRYNV